MWDRHRALWPGHTLYTLRFNFRKLICMNVPRSNRWWIHKTRAKHYPSIRDTMKKQIHNIFYWITKWLSLLQLCINICQWLPDSNSVGYLMGLIKVVSVLYLVLTIAWGKLDDVTENTNAVTHGRNANSPTESVSNSDQWIRFRLGNCR